MDTMAQLKQREVFEKVCVPSFPGNLNGVRRLANGMYASDALEDHWQTFQEGWEEGVKAAMAILMARHEESKSYHNYFHYAANQVQKELL